MSGASVKPGLDDIALKSSFEPIADARTRVLILGALPGEMSLERRQYYANPTNQFWRLMAGVTGRDLIRQPYDERLASLLEAGVGLWDVVKSARRSGSLDSHIREASPNNLDSAIVGLPALRALAFNGGKAYASGRKQLGIQSRQDLIALPSSSAAYCSVSFEHKLAVWMELKRFLRQSRQPA